MKEQALREGSKLVPRLIFAILKETEFEEEVWEV